MSIERVILLSVIVMGIANAATTLFVLHMLEDRLKSLERDIDRYYAGYLAMSKEDARQLTNAMEVILNEVRSIRYGR